MEPLVELIEMDTYTSPPLYVRIYNHVIYTIRDYIYRLLVSNFRFSLKLLRAFQGPSKLVEHAKREFEIAGWFKRGEEDDDLGYEMNLMMAQNMYDLLEVFANQGHSGFSGSYAINLFKRLANYGIITPLTGEPDEWNNISEHYGRTEKVYQNNRISHVFKDKDGAYDIEGKVFVEPDGGAYTSGDSRVYIEFPYIPKTTYVYVDANGVPTGEEKVADR